MIKQKQKKIKQEFRFFSAIIRLFLLVLHSPLFFFQVSLNKKNTKHERALKNSSLFVFSFGFCHHSCGKNAFKN